MKKMVKTYIPATKEHFKLTEESFCDICKHNKSSYECILCKRDICKRCVKYHPDDYDYPSKYCSKCFKLRFSKYKKEFEALEEEYDLVKKALYDRICFESFV